MQQVTLQVNGMSCGHCVSAVKNALATVPGVTVDSVIVGKAVISYDPSRTNSNDITAALQDVGYEAYATP